MLSFFAKDIYLLCDEPNIYKTYITFYFNELFNTGIQKQFLKNGCKSEAHLTTSQESLECVSLNLTLIFRWFYLIYYPSHFYCNKQNAGAFLLFEVIIWSGVKIEHKGEVSERVNR